MDRSRSATAFQNFLVSAKSFWMTEMYGALKADYRERSRGRTPRTAADVADVMRDSTTYAYYAWLERHIQRAKYAGRWGLVHLHADDRPLLDDQARAKLRLDPTVSVADYYTHIDTHQHPGNLHGAPNAGLIYKSSATSTQPGATGGYVLHERFAKLVAEHGRFSRILDMGCGFGKSALPLAQTFHEAEVTGIDVSAPCLEQAAVEAAQAHLDNLYYEQADLLRAPYEPTQFDLATSTMVLHELDQPAVHATFAECYRLLAPGGMTIHLDFRVKDPFLEFVHYGHGVRNNEPYMEPFNEMDVERALREAGFADVKTVPFAEVDGATDPSFPAWRFPWTVFVARKPAGTS